MFECLGWWFSGDREGEEVGEVIMVSGEEIGIREWDFSLFGAGILIGEGIFLF